MIQNKALGQHFLTNEKIVNQIVDLIKPKLCNQILEIGPGTGAFTFKLKENAEKLIAVEKDPVLFEYLNNIVTEGLNTNIQLINSDILNTDIKSLNLDYFSVFGSLPYNQSKEIIKRFLFLENPRPKNLFFIVQKEVAQKYLPEQDHLTYYSILSQLTSTSHKLFDIGPGSFTPHPKVQSALIEFDLKPNIEKALDTAHFAEQLFKQPRKTVRNNLLSQRLMKESQIIKIPQKILDKRPSELTIDEIHDLYLLYNDNQ